MSEHTPGPWSIQFDDETGWPRAIKATEEHVTYIDGSRYCDETEDPEAMANARLIAAAPELLAACQAVVESSMENDAAFFEAWKLCDKAITKAEGE